MTFNGEHSSTCRCSRRATGSTASASRWPGRCTSTCCIPRAGSGRRASSPAACSRSRRALLGLRRRGDVPGEEIPHIYFDFVRRRDGRGLARVLEHNRLDIVSLAALAVLACQWVEGGQRRGPARRLLPGPRPRARGALRALRRAVPPRARGRHGRRCAAPSLLRLAARAKRARDYGAPPISGRGGARRGGGLARAGDPPRARPRLSGRSGRRARLAGRAARGSTARLAPAEALDGDVDDRAKAAQRLQS